MKMLLHSFAISAGDELEAFGNDIRASILCKEMDMVGDDDLSEYAETEALLGFEYPAQVTATITCELEKKFFLMAVVVICQV